MVAINLSLLSLACLVLAVRAGASNPHGLPTFTEFMTGKSDASAGGLSTAGAHDPARHVEFCLQDIKWSACSAGLPKVPELTGPITPVSPAAAPSYQANTRVTCCAGGHQAGRDGYGADGVNNIKILQDIELGSCNWQFDSMSQPGPDYVYLDEAETTNLAGVVQGTCFLKDASRTCSSAPQDSMVVSIQAFVYFTPVYTYLPSNSVPTDDSCQTSHYTLCYYWPAASLGGIACPDARRTAAQLQSPAARVMSVKKGVSKVATADSSRQYGSSAAEFAGDGTGQLYSGNAWVIYGTMYAVSDGAAGSLSPIGLFEWTPFVDLQSPMTAVDQPTKPAPFVQQGTTRLRFTRLEKEY